MASFAEFFDEAVESVGGFPVGDPNELRRYAKTLRTRSMRARSAVKHVEGAIKDGGLERGPLAERLKSTANRNSADYVGVASRMEALADFLDREANALETKQNNIKAFATRFANGKLLEQSSQ